MIPERKAYSIWTDDLIPVTIQQVAAAAIATVSTAYDGLNN
jgi:hypothetical protein